MTEEEERQDDEEQTEEEDTSTDSEEEADDTEEEDAEEGSDDEEEEDDSEEEEDGEDPKDQQIRVLQEKLDRKTAQLDRIKGKPSKKGEQSSTGPDYDRLYLVASGLKDKEEQTEVIKAAKRMGVPVDEALEDEYVQAKLEKMRKSKTTKRAVARPSNGSAPAKRDVDWYIRTGKVPTDPKLLAERAERLAQLARDRS